MACQGRLCDGYRVRTAPTAPRPTAPRAPPRLPSPLAPPQSFGGAINGWVPQMATRGIRKASAKALFAKAGAPIVAARYVRAGEQVLYPYGSGMNRHMRLAVLYARRERARRRAAAAR